MSFIQRVSEVQCTVLVCGTIKYRWSFSLVQYKNLSLSLSLIPDYMLMALWIVLLVVGVTIQTTVVQIRRTKHNRRQQKATNDRQSRKKLKFSSFPRPSLLRKLLRYSNRNCSAEGEPLLTPSHLSHHGPWSSHSNGVSSPSDSGRYPSNYGAMGATTVNDPAVLIVKK